jgi:oligopeptide/dipeptide ABC transporter ATP-binding protein
MDQPLLAVKDLTVGFPAGRGLALAVDSASLAMQPGEVRGLVGESGCGKTMLSLSVLGLVPPPGRITAGEVLFAGQDLRRLPEEGLRAVRGAQAAMIFQEPMTSLNPVMRVGEQMVEGLRLHKGLGKGRAMEAAGELFGLVRLPEPGRVLASYPFELSGGMRQRVMIAMALSCEPRLIIADEPTTALDVTIQKQILELLRELTEVKHVSLLLITHNLGVVAQLCAQVSVMYAGQMVDVTPVEALFEAPLHPYTQGLLASLPKPGIGRGRLTPIKGTVPSMDSMPVGCRFHPRCPKAFEPCAREMPPFFNPEPGREVRCWLYA